MLFVILIILTLVSGIGFVCFLLGARVSGSHWQRELLQVRTEAAEAARELHAMTVNTMMAVAEEMDRHRRRD